MKKIISVISIFFVLFLLASCTESETRAVLDNSEASVFNDFYTEGDTVIIDCSLNIYADADCTVKISAIDSGNVEIGLLKNKILVGKSADGSDEFKLEKGENTVQVNFIGEYAGIYQISERAIPKFIDIEVIK